MAAPDPAPQLFKDSSCTGGGVHTCSLWMAGSETGLVAAEVTAPVKLSSAPGHVPVIVARAVTPFAAGVNRRGIPTSRGGAWSATQVRRVLEGERCAERPDGSGGHDPLGWGVRHPRHEQAGVDWQVCLVSLHSPLVCRRPAPVAHRIDNLANGTDHKLRLLLVDLVAALRVRDVLCIPHKSGELLL